MADIKTVKFLGATVISFNSNLGLGSVSESSLNVDLVEDCEEGDIFQPNQGSVQVGEPVYFQAGEFTFNGILTNWTISQGGSGKIFNVRVNDPRQLLENTIITIDSYIGPPAGDGRSPPNYFNVYHKAEEAFATQGNCNAFGASQSNERGMPYNKIISTLRGMDPIIQSPTGFEFDINWESFPTNLPEYYRVTGPGISVLQLLQDVCDATGKEFYVYLEGQNTISVGTIDLTSTPSLSTYAIMDAFNGEATDISYGQELRNEKTRTLIFGEQQHYLTYVDSFEFYFGEDLVGDKFVPIVPFKRNKSGFWIKKKIDQLNTGLFKPFPTNGPYEISELDLRVALSGYENWQTRALDDGTDGTFNQAIRANYTECVNQLQNRIKEFTENKDNLHPKNRQKALVDLFWDPSLPGVELAKPKPLIDLEKIHEFLLNLATTYYGVQFIAKLKQKICVHLGGENFQEKIFTDIPTGAGGWVDGDVPIMGLSEPELSFFRSDDFRINSFATFTLDGQVENAPGSPGGDGEEGGSGNSGSDSSYGQSSSSFGSDT